MGPRRAAQELLPGRRLPTPVIDSKIQFKFKLMPLINELQTVIFEATTMKLKAAFQTSAQQGGIKAP